MTKAGNLTYYVRKFCGILKQNFDLLQQCYKEKRILLRTELLADSFNASKELSKGNDALKQQLEEIKLNIIRCSRCIYKISMSTRWFIDIHRKDNPKARFFVQKLQNFKLDDHYKNISAAWRGYDLIYRLVGNREFDLENPKNGIKFIEVLSEPKCFEIDQISLNWIYLHYITASLELHQDTVSINDGLCHVQYIFNLEKTFIHTESTWDKELKKLIDETLPFFCE